jgi:DNA-binding PadR family transcriptional regulator
MDKFLPLQEPTFYVLLCLRGGARHGYAILKEVKALSGERIRLSTGTLYGALNRLWEQGLIERGEDGDGDGARGKKLYRLTPRGLEVFEAELGRMERLLRAARGERTALA